MRPFTNPFLTLFHRKAAAGLLALLLGVSSSILAQQPPAGPLPSADSLVSMLMAQPRLARDVPVVAKAVFDPPAVRPGEEAVYRVSLNALEDMIEWPERVTAPPQLALREGARGYILQMSGTNMEAHTSFLYHTRPNAEGQHRVPGFTIKVDGQDVAIPPAELIVSSSVPANAPRPLRLLVEVPQQTMYVGQAVRPRVLLPFPFGAIQTLAQVTFNGQGFLVDQSALRQRIEPMAQRGSNVISFIYEPLLTPIASGKIKFTVQGWSMVNRAVTSAVTTPGGASTFTLEVSQTLVDSDPVEITVKPLPPHGGRPGFTGAVGIYTNDPPKLSTNAVRVGDIIKLRATFRGDGNVARLVPPPAPKSTDWQVFEASGDPAPPNVLNAQGAVTFTYTLVPLKHGVLTTPPIPWTYFDTRQEQYVTLEVAPVRVMVTPGPFGTAPEVFVQASTNRQDTPAAPTLRGLAQVPGLTVASLQPVQSRPWFPVLQVAPALAFLGLWAWDRRRRYLMQHPDILLKRRARRELRRHRRRLAVAAAGRDAQSFAHIAVEALRTAVAPHYPATPHALVGIDVLRVLGTPAPTASAAEVVRRVFDATDATDFSPDHPDNSVLLSLHPELEKVLDELDGKLKPRRTAAEPEPAAMEAME